jgi:hypothetical protein
MIAAAAFGISTELSYGFVTYDPFHQFTGTQGLWCALGGPLQTMITGTIGLLFVRRIPRNVQSLSLVQWITIGTSLFWLRQPANLFAAIVSYVSYGYLLKDGDEIWLSRQFGIPDITLLLLTGIVGALVLAYVVFRVIPSQQRITFLMSGLVGGLLGAVLWFNVVGPVILP